MKQFAILIISSFLLTGNILSQVWYNAEPDEHRLVYWFHVRVKIIEDDSTGYVSYVITEVQNKLSHGNLIEYQTDLFKSLKNNILPIGPFYDFHEAWKSKIIYEHAVLDSITDYYDDSFISKDSTFDDNQQVFWFIIHIEMTKNRIKLIPKPGAIASGDYYDFAGFLKDNLGFRVFSIGPFLYMPEAEESKRIYRLKKRRYLRNKIGFKFRNLMNMY